MRLLSTIHTRVDKSCSVAVVSAVALVNLYTTFLLPNTVVVPFFTSCCCLTAAFSKALKRVLNQSRPRGAPKLSPGMPSNHATSLAFLHVATVYGLQRFASSAAEEGAKKLSTSSPGPLPSPAPTWVLPVQAMVVLYSIYATSLRVTCGYHTIPQVMVGFSLGAASATFCLAMNYWGYTGARAGGRVDELATPSKTFLLLTCATISGMSMLAIVRGARGARPVSRSSSS